MDKSTELTEQQKTVNKLLARGFRVAHSGHDIIILTLPKHASTVHIAQVTEDGNVNTVPLGTFLDEVLSW
jgi:hypothetical protein